MADIIEYPLKAIERVTMERNSLIAEVERLQAVVEVARVATAKWPRVNHSRIKEGVPGTLYVNGLPQCPATYGRNPCECGADEANAARIEARRALGLEVGK